MRIQISELGHDLLSTRRCYDVTDAFKQAYLWRRIRGHIFDFTVVFFMYVIAWVILSVISEVQPGDAALRIFDSF